MCKWLIQNRAHPEFIRFLGLHDTDSLFTIIVNWIAVLTTGIFSFYLVRVIVGYLDSILDYKIMICFQKAINIDQL